MNPLQQTEQLMLNFGESPRYQPIDTIDPLTVITEIERLYNSLYALCATLGVDIQTHASFGVRSRDHTFQPAWALERLTLLHHSQLRLIHLLGLSRYSAAAFTEFFNSETNLLHPDGKIHTDSNNLPIRPPSYSPPDYRSILDLYNPRPLFADHVNPTITSDDSDTSF